MELKFDIKKRLVGGLLTRLKEKSKRERKRYGNVQDPK